MVESLQKKRNIWITAGLLLLGIPTLAAEKTADFESGSWQLGPGSRIEEYLGRKALTLTGTAFLKDVEFENGVVEVEVACKEGRSFPAIIFRRQDEDNYEEFYLRPHKSGQPDALQYSPVFNGISAWQLYYGRGYTNTWILPKEEWIKIRLELTGRQARVFVGEANNPALVIDDLKLGQAKGGLGLKVTGPSGLAYFSDFRYRTDDTLEFNPPPKKDTPFGMITEWELSQSFLFNLLERKAYPPQNILDQADWMDVTSESTGLVNISRYTAKGPVIPGYVLVKTTIHAENNKQMELQFGYSDLVSIFMNGRLYFHGNNVFQSRDPFFQGRVGLFDSLFLPLKKGDNELLLLLAESMGGWGFMCRDGGAVYIDKSLEKAWEIAATLSYPETVVYDKKRDVFFISNLYADGNQFISKVNMNGEVAELKWIKGLIQPAGMVLIEDMLFVVERSDLVKIDILSGQIVERRPVPKPGFLNDIAADSSGNLYISDTQFGRILKFSGGEFSTWKSGNEFAQVNGLHCSEGKLYAGVSSDASLKVIDLKSGEIRTIARLDPGAIVDGIETDGKGNILVSDYNGKLFAVNPAGQKFLLLDRTAPERFCANFVFVPDKRLFVIPSLNDNRVTAFMWKGE